MIVLSTQNEAGERSIVVTAFTMLLNGAAFLLVIGLVIRYILPRLLHLLSRSQELLVMFGILGREPGDSGRYPGFLQRGVRLCDWSVIGFHALSGCTGCAPGQLA